MSLKSLLRDRYYDVRHIYSNICISSVIRKKRKKHKDLNGKACIKIGFIARGGLSEMVEDLYHELRVMENVETSILVCPIIDRQTGTICDDTFLYEKYPDAISMVDRAGNVRQIKEMDLDYVIFFEQYPQLYLKGLRDTVIVRNALCCYIPYGISGSKEIDISNAKNPFFYSMHIYFSSSESDLEEHKKGIKWKWDERVHKKVFLGFPYLERFIEKSKDSVLNSEDIGEKWIPRVTWTPRWTVEKGTGVGGSNFLRYKDLFWKFSAKNHDRYHFCFRPHPMMFDELIIKGYMTEKEKREYISKLENVGIVINMTSPIEEILDGTDILISDFSSIVVPFTILGKPVIYCDGGVILNNEVERISRQFYVTYSWEQVEERLDELSERITYIDKCNSIKAFSGEYFNKNIHAAKRMAEYIINDYKGV